MKKILTILGARPQFVKASVVSRAIAQTGVMNEILVHTGQHFDANMSDVFFSELSMPAPKYNLGIHSGLHGAMTGQMLEGIESLLLDEKPDVVLVYGDTNSTLAGALASAKLHIPVAHVEAGLRSFNMRMPEEINRILTDRISTWLFTPTEAAAEHLRQEGVSDGRIVSVGDVMYDAALHFGLRANATGGILDRLGALPGGYILATVHRAENTDDSARLAAIVSALSQSALTLPVIWPLHPRTRAALQRSDLLDGMATSGVRLIDPVGYLEMVELEKHAALIVTDSGGVQKEAYFYEVPCVTLRDETEWVELLESGWNRLAPPTDAALVTSAIQNALGVRGRKVSLYGKGDAADKIASKLAADIG
jgi:UDP-GlcNAc3NAcA epimerase